MPLNPLLALGSLVFIFVNWLKFVRARDWNATITQLCAWAAGVGAVELTAHTQYAHGIVFGGVPLDAANGGTLVFLGLIATSLLSTVNELRKAIDNSDTSVTPKLLADTPTISSTP